VKAIEPFRIAIAGIGKIARDEHVPAITRNPNFELSASISRNAKLDGIENFTGMEEFLRARTDVTVIALCVPPQVRYEMARQALFAGRHVLLEKPPAATLAEIYALKKIARDKGLTLFATWHSRFAPAVEPAKKWLKSRKIKQVDVVWKEDVRVWHPGQNWIWKSGGAGVFDPGINALSILTGILPQPIRLLSAELEIPENHETPIAVQLQFEDMDSAPVSANFDWCQEGPQIWDITIETDAGMLIIRNGGARLEIGVRTLSLPETGEYDGIYAQFAELLSSASSSVDLVPFILMAYAFMLGKADKSRSIYCIKW
jgi:D-galactose 1-dehydrogenase